MLDISMKRITIDTMDAQIRLSLCQSTLPTVWSLGSRVYSMKMEPQLESIGSLLILNALQTNQNATHSGAAEALDIYFMT